MDEVQALIKQKGEELGVEDAKWEVTGWRFSKPELVEGAFCMCRDYPFTAADFGPPPGVTRTYLIHGIGEARDAQMDKTRFRLVRPKHAPSCMLLQSVFSSEPNNVAAAFFSSLALSPNPAPRLSAQPPAGSVAERLRQLDQLLKDRLISPDEYNTRRRVVLDSL